MEPKRMKYTQTQYTTVYHKNKWTKNTTVQLVRVAGSKPVE